MDKLIGVGAGHSLSLALAYVAVLALMAVALAALVIHGRYGARVSLGDGGDKMLNRRIRAHGNFSEYAPFLALLLIGLALLGASETLVHAVGLTGLVGRVLHPIGLVTANALGWPRRAGMVLTFIALVTGAVSILVLAFK